MAGMFKAKVRFVLAVTLANACVSVSLGSQADLGDRNFTSAKQQVQIRVFNLARVPRRDLSRAEGEVTRIFAEAEIEVHWAEGALDDGASLITDQSADNTSPAGCKVARHARELRLQLLLHAPQGVTTGTLGYSLPCAAFGIDSTIFIDHCEGVTYQSLASFSKVLAYSMAHELGHLLLRSDEHSPTGLMRARWDRASWIRATVAGIPIDREQARRMRIELSRMESLAATENSR
jgi:hypothetical protein